MPLDAQITMLRLWAQLTRLLYILYTIRGSFDLSPRARTSIRLCDGPQQVKYIYASRGEFQECIYSSGGDYTCVC